MDYLNEMGWFVEVVKARSFTRAAERIGMPKSTLSSRISGLERHLGVQLLKRTTRKLELTEAGAFYFQNALRLLEEIRHAHQQLHEMQTRPRGLLRISAPMDLAYEFIAPELPAFCSLYTDISFEFDVTPRRIDLIDEPFDLAIRTGQLADSSLISQLLITIPRYLYASPGYLARHGAPGHPSELARHHCIRLTVSGHGGWRLMSEDDAIVFPVPDYMVMNNMGMALRLARLGMGIILAPEGLVRSMVVQGELIRLLPAWRSTDVPVHALTASRLIPAKTRCFIDFLKESWKKWNHADVLG